MRLSLAVVALAGAVFSATAFAEDAAGPAQPASDPDRIVCKVMDPPTGTRLGSRRVCQTEHQWEQMQQDNEKFTSDVQTHDRAGTLGH